MASTTVDQDSTERFDNAIPTIVNVTNYAAQGETQMVSDKRKE